MPQMSPMPWIFLLIMSLIMLVMMNSLIYFYSSMNLTFFKKMIHKPLNLKW